MKLKHRDKSYSLNKACSEFFDSALLVVEKCSCALSKLRFFNSSRLDSKNSKQTLNMLRSFIVSTITTVLFLISFNLSSTIYGEELSERELLKSRPAREVVWSFDMSILRYHMLLPDQSKLFGSGASFSVGYGRTRQNSWLLGRFHFLAGPWDLSRNETFDSDYFGTSIDVEYGTAFPGTSLRSGSAPILSIATAYIDLNGRNIGGNRKNNGNPNDAANYTLEQDFKSALGALTVVPSMGWAWTQASRPLGNEVDLQLTRVESAYVKFGIQVPLYSRARVEVNKRAQNDEVSQTPQKHTTTGTVRGYSLNFTTGVWLGI